MAHMRGCTLARNFYFLWGRKSAIFGVWAAPGALETLQKGGGLRPSHPPRLDPKNGRLPTLIFEKIWTKPKCSHACGAKRPPPILFLMMSASRRLGHSRPRPGVSDISGPGSILDFTV